MDQELNRLSLEIVKKSNIGLEEMAQIEHQLIWESTANEIQNLLIHHRLAMASLQADHQQHMLSMQYS